MTGETPDLERVFTWRGVLEAYGEEATAEVYERILSPERIRTREPYPSAAEVLRGLQAERGVRVHFVTRNDDSRPLEAHLLPWLREHFGPAVGLTVTSGDKIRVVRELGAFGLVDDHPQTLVAVAGAGLWAATKIQPWNRAVITEREDVLGFDEWTEMPRLLPPIAGEISTPT